MAGLKVPIICVVIGEGGSGGALALGVGDRIYMLENSTYSVISPEGAASILWKDATQAKRAAESMQITAPDLNRLGVIDGIIPEVRGGAHRNMDEQAQAIEAVLEQALPELLLLSSEELVNQRYMKFKQIGEYTVIKEEKEELIKEKQTEEEQFTNL